MKARVQHASLLRRPDVERDERFSEATSPLRRVNLTAVCAGKSDAVRDYADAWAKAGHELLSRVRAENPDLHEPPLIEEALQEEALYAPFSAWVASRGGEGLALDLLARLRSMLVPQADPLPAPTSRQSALSCDDAAVARFRKLLLASFRSHTAAERIRESYGLNSTELARLFGVSRQAVVQWADGEVPASKLGKAAVVIAIADILRYRLKEGRLPLVARRPAGAYGGLTMLEMIERDRHEELLELVRRSFDYSATA